MDPRGDKRYLTKGRKRYGKQIKYLKKFYVVLYAKKKLSYLNG